MDRRTNKQMDRHADLLFAIFRNPPADEVKMSVQPASIIVTQQTCSDL